jgi:hypothetical protein
LWIPRRISGGRPDAEESRRHGAEDPELVSAFMQRSKPPLSLQPPEFLSFCWCRHIGGNSRSNLASCANFLLSDVI